jgi:hypothetical protein
VVTQWVDGIVQILHAEEYHRPDYNEMLSVVYGLTFHKIAKTADRRRSRL